MNYSYGCSGFFSNIKTKPVNGNEKETGFEQTGFLVYIQDCLLKYPLCLNKPVQQIELNY
jgi:Fe-S cluster assembly iron-binding protein IscA